MVSIRSRRLRIAVGVLLAAGALVGPRVVHAADGLGAQVAATVGAVAYGNVSSAMFPDGSERWLRVRFVIPDNPLYVSPAATGLDLGQPWVVVNHWEMLWGSEVCSTAMNPRNWHRGALDNARAWNGVFVDVPCDDGVYSFYRVSWDPGSGWMSRNQYTLAMFGAQNDSWSGGGLNGGLQYYPDALQHGTMTVCGHKPGSPDGPGGFDCYHGRGFVVPYTTTMLAQTYASGG